MELMKALDDLIKQATTEKSHYYTASVLKACKNQLQENEMLLTGYRQICLNFEEENKELKRLLNDKGE